MVADKIGAWIAEQLEQGKTVEELNGTHIIMGNSVIKLKKSGKKFNLEVQLGCVVLKEE